MPYPGCAACHFPPAFTDSRLLQAGPDGDGNTSRLSALERERLVAFLMQLDDASEGSGVRGPKSAGAAGKSGLRAARIGSPTRFRCFGAECGTRRAPEIRSFSGVLIRTLDMLEGGGDEPVWTAYCDGRAGGDGSGASFPPGTCLVRNRMGAERTAKVFTWMP